MAVYANGRDTSLRTYGAGPGTGDITSKVLALASPGVGAEASFFTENGITLSRLVGAIRGSGGPSATWTLRFAATRDAAGTEAIVGGTTTSDEAAGSSDIMFSNGAIPPGSFVWLEVTATGGTVDELSVTIIPAVPS